MLIDHKHKLVFIHITKNGGTSILHGLKCERDGWHKFISEVTVPKGYETVAIIRDVVDRFISGYAFSKMKRNMYHQANTTSQNLDYDLVNSYDIDVLISKEYEAFKQKSTLFKGRSFEPQYPYVEIDGRIVVNHLFRFDNWPEKVNELLIEKGFDPVSFPLINISPNKPSISEFCKKLLRNIYSRDNILYTQHSK